MTEIASTPPARSTPRKATLLVLAWNRWDLTEKCLATLLATDLPDTEVLVVDNGSTDETPVRLAAMPGIRVLRLEKNLGFVRGNNAGIAAADPESDLVLLNNDLIFTQHDWLARLRAAAASDPKIGVVGCRLCLPDGRLLHAGTYILPDTMWGQQIGSLEQDLGQFTAEVREVEGIVFACALIKRELLGQIGGLALDFESYFEDTDYCLRAQAAGWKTVVCGGVTLIHDEHGSTQNDPDALGDLFQTSRATFRAKWGAELAGRYEHKLLWQSIMNFPTGYAMSCREILRALDVQGVEVAYRYVYGPRTVFAPVEPENSEDYRLNVLRSRKVSWRPKAAVVYGQADVFGSNRGRIKVGYTMLEVDGFPPDWVRAAQKMDEVWVPSEFNRRGFLESGLKRPIEIIPLGVDTNYFHPGLSAFPNPLGEFVFFSAFEWGERKEPGLLLKIFNDEFGCDEPVRLVCKVINRDPGLKLKEEIRALRLRDQGGRISFLFNQEFPHYQLGSLYRSMDCFVSVSRGEGWNMPLMEAMACGLPAIATDWGAHREFVHEGNAYPLRVRGTIPAIAKCPYYAGFRWADPDPEHLRHLMRQVFENQAEARAKGAAAAREMAERWTWAHTAKKIVARLTALGA
ncbi:MAG TPA: glycosyltransferase [Thermoanaerobaculia bacterium]|jgi:GT2 family glycosyltransferase|nr:glycosyltransferase [Thermoanaerobaculia bacterium]